MATFLDLQPRWPYCRSNAVERSPPFFAVNEPLPIVSTPFTCNSHHGRDVMLLTYRSALQLLAILMGFQVPYNTSVSM